MWYDGYFLIDMTNCTSAKKLAKWKNSVLFQSEFFRLFDVAMQRYKLTGLPDTVQERVILQSLIVYGNVTFFEQNGNILALPSAPSGEGYNINGDPVSAWVFSRNGLFNKEIGLYVPGGESTPLIAEGVNNIKRPDKGVMVWESKTRYPFLQTILYYAAAISDTLRTIDVARKWLKTPFIAVAEQSLVPSVEKMLNDITNNREYMLVSTGIQDISKFNILPVEQSTNSIQSATELIDWYTQQYRAHCGMRSNSNIDKKGENLISDEIHTNDSYTDSIADNMTEYLNNQLDFVNEIFGTKIKAEINESSRPDLRLYTEETGEKIEGGTNEPNNNTAE